MYAHYGFKLVHRITPTVVHLHMQETLRQQVRNSHVFSPRFQQEARSNRGNSYRNRAEERA